MTTSGNNSGICRNSGYIMIIFNTNFSNCSAFSNSCIFLKFFFCNNYKICVSNLGCFVKIKYCIVQFGNNITGKSKSDRCMDKDNMMVTMLMLVAMVMVKMVKMSPLLYTGNSCKSHFNYSV